MQIIKQIVGIDISMDKYDVRFGTLTLKNNQLSQELLAQAVFPNTDEGHEEYLQWALKQRVSDDCPITFIMEATGVYYENLAYYLSEHNQKIAVILPNKAKSFSKTLENKSKTDKLDADMLTLYGLEKELECWKIPAEIMKKLKILTREYHTIKQTRAQVKNRRHAHQHSHNPFEDVTKILNQQINFYTNQLKAIEKRIIKLVQKDKDLNDKINKKDKIEGVGPMTIISILAETDCFSLVLNSKQLASYAGLDVTYKESGTKKGKTCISRKGNSHLRNSVYMPALTAIRCNPKLKALYARLMAKGKCHEVAHIAVARKLLLLIYAIWKKNTEYIKNYQPGLSSSVA